MRTEKRRPSFFGKVLAGRVYPEFFPIHPADTVLFAGCGQGAQVLAYGKVGAKLVGVDVQEKRVTVAKEHIAGAGIQTFEGIVGNLESLPFPDAHFDKVIAVDIIQHVKSPERVLVELRRVLKPAGELLITFPALQHYALTTASRWRHGRPGEWHPDAFNHNLPLSVWLYLAAKSGLKQVRSRATTLFPPLHRWGIPRFWFSNEFLHRIDWFFGGLPALKQLGQAVMCVYRKS